MHAAAEQAILQVQVVKNRIAERRELMAGPAPRGRRGSSVPSGWPQQAIG
jgi:hypothetical protein